MKLVSFSPELTEFFSVPALQPHLAGITDSCRAPGDRIPVLLKNGAPDWELLHAVSPDLILFSGPEQSSLASDCSTAGFQILHLMPVSVFTVPDRMVLLGNLTGQADEMAREATRWLAELKSLQYQGARDVNRVTAYPERPGQPGAPIPFWFWQILESAGISPADPALAEAGRSPADEIRFHFDAALFILPAAEISPETNHQLALERNRKSGSNRWHEEAVFLLPEEELLYCSPRLTAGLRSLLRIRSLVEARGPVINQME